MIAIMASFLIATNAPAAELVESCRTMIPTDVTLTGRIVRRNRRGIVQDEHDYVLVRSNAMTRLTIDGKAYNPPVVDGVAPKSGILGTDVTWSDVTLDYLWWDEFSFEAEREGETVHGQVCSVVVMKLGERAVRVWVDRKTGAMMQAEELDKGRPMRRLWGTRLKRFGERWVPNVLEVETLGSGHRTKITVETLK